MTAESRRTISQSKAQNLLGHVGPPGRQPSQDGSCEPLTGREEEILELLVQGVTTTHELAASLIVSNNTVKFHLRNILDKLHLHNRAEVVAHASRQQRLDLVHGLEFAHREALRR